MEPKTSYTFELNLEQQKELTALLQSGNYRPAVIPYTLIAADAENCRIALYRSGKCLVQGRNAADFVSFFLEPLVLKSARLGYEEILSPEIAEPHIGVDESGKGDFFGPLVTAAAYIDKSLLDPMQRIGVKDSKQISSDRRALEISREIQRLLGNRYTIVAIGPARYNSLYRQMRSVNTILAWAHARSIENLLEKVPHCTRAVSDQFGNKNLVIRALMKRGQTIELVQRHRAEADLAVAAASILARAAFLMALRKFEETYGQPFPKGASPAVQEAARKLIESKGPSILLATAKCHFRTTDAVLEKCGHKRQVLGPEGAAMSKPPQARGFYHRKTAVDGGEEPA